MSRRRNPAGPMRPLVIRLSPDDRLTIELDARRRGMTAAALLRDIIAAYLASTPAGREGAR